MGLKEEVLNVLNMLDKNMTIHLENASGGKIGGYVTSKGFKGKSQIERQKTLWDYLEKNLGKEKLSKIVAILTLTPDEADEDE